MGRGDHMPGLFGCLRKPIILVNNCLCGCCMVGRQCAAVEGQPNSMSVPHCLGSLFAFNLCVCCIRRKIEEKYNFGENCCVSLCVSFVCGCCSLAQTHRLLRRVGANPGYMIAPPKLDLIPEDKRSEFQAARQKRREERRERNAKRRAARSGGKGSSSESSSSD